MENSNSKSKILAVIRKLTKQKPRKKLTEKEWQQLSIRSGSVAGKSDVKEMVEAAKTNLAREKASVFSSGDVKIPKWIKAFIERGKSPEEALRYLLERVEKAPTTNALLLTQALVNELLRKKSKSKVVSQMLTQKTVQKFISLSQPKTQ